MIWTQLRVYGTVSCTVLVLLNRICRPALIYFSSVITVLTATSHSNGASLWLFIFSQPTWRSDASTNFHAKWLKQRESTQGRAFWSKNRNFLNPWPPEPQNRKKLAHFGWDFENFRPILPLTLAVLMEITCGTGNGYAPARGSPAMMMTIVIKVN